MRGCAFVATAAAVATLAFAATAQAGSTLRIGLSTEVDYTDPALDYLGTGWQLEYATCAKLLNYRDKPDAGGGKLIAEVATDLPAVSGDGRTYTFTIRDGLKFSDGSTLTAADVAWTFQRTLSPGMQSPANLFMRDLVGEPEYVSGAASSIAGLSLVGNRISFTLQKPAGDFLARVAMPFFCIVPRTLAIDPSGALTPPSAGPYYISARTPNVSITLSRSPYYAGDRRSRFDQIQYVIGSSLDSQEASIRAGGLDYAASGLPPADYQSLHDTFGDGSAAAALGFQQFFVNTSTSISYLGLNTSRPAFSNPRLRLAVSYAVDRTALSNVNDAISAFALTPTDRFLTPGLPGYSADGSFFPTSGPDLVKAKALAAQAGVTPQTPLSVTLYTSNNGTAPARAQLLQDELAQIGLNVTINAFPRGEQIQRESTPGEPFDLTTEGWVLDYFDPQDLLEPLMGGGGIASSSDPLHANVSHFDGFDARFDAARPLTTTAKRSRAYSDIERDLLHTALPIVPLSNTNQRDFFAQRVGCQRYVPPYGMDLAALCERDPMVASFSPTSGPAGTTVTITGARLTDATGVTLCKTPATFVVNSDTQITATVPAGKCNGPWRVITDGGKAASDASFSVTRAH